MANKRSLFILYLLILCLFGAVLFGFWNSMVKLRHLVGSLESDIAKYSNIEERIDLAHKELNKTIATLNAAHGIEEEIRQQAYKFTMLKAIDSAMTKVQHGNDAKQEIEILRQFADANALILANELKEMYDASKTPSNAVFIAVISNMIYLKKNMNTQQDGTSVVENLLQKFVTVEDTHNKEDRDALLFALHAAEHNHLEYTLEIVKRLAYKNPVLQEMVPSLQFKSNVNYLLKQLRSLVLGYA